ncbi:MAG TPA: response regulator transcription factor [Gaiellales bacterium]
MDERVLLVEDDASIREVVGIGLRQAGMQVTGIGDGREALAQFRLAAYDIVLLDVMLPSLDGFEVLRELRRTSRVPVVMLTARTETVDVVVGLELGADDYVTKPFEMPELAARVRAVLRRGSPPREAGAFAVGGIDVDPAGFQARRDGTDLGLTTTEFKLLVALATHRGQVLSREQLLDQVWGYDFLGDSRLVDVAVQRLRAKVEADPAHPALIETVRGVGYRFTVTPA